VNPTDSFNQSARGEASHGCARIAVMRRCDSAGVQCGGGTRGEFRTLHAMSAFVPRDAFGVQMRSGKGVPGQSTALHLRGRRCAPTSLRCSAAWPAAELASLTSFAALRQWRRVSLQSALARAATRPALLGASQARRGLSGHAFADTAVACVENSAREESSRQVVPGGGDLWSDEKRSPAVGARSALRRLTRRSCLSGVSAANAASCATRLRGEHRSAVGAQRRPRNHEPPAGTAWRDVQAIAAGAAWREASSCAKLCRGI